MRGETLKKFRLGGNGEEKRSGEGRRNSHLSLLAMVDCWYQCGIVPYEHMICATPVSLVRGGGDGGDTIC